MKKRWHSDLDFLRSFLLIHILKPTFFFTPKRRTPSSFQEWSMIKPALSKCGTQ